MSATVLLVEDEADVMLTLRIILQTAGYRTIEASTGEEALVILEDVVPDVMILDLWLPGIDGWQVLATIRQSGLLPDTPIIVASANTQPDQRTLADKLGCTAMFTKPFSAEDLRRTVAGALARHPAV